MKTATEILVAAGSCLVDGVKALLGDDVPLRNLNEPGGDLVILGSSFSFPDLPLDKKRLQSSLINDRQRFFDVVRALLCTQASGVLKRIDEREKIVRDVVEQEYLVLHSTTGEALAAVREAVDEILEEINSLHDPSEGAVILIPDSNALLK